ncbi:MAG: serine/threonine protein kinase, partial [Syntrophothermus sp.]
MVGRVINNYKFISVLGEGGMGIIYRAFDTKLDRYVAIKILKPKVLGQEKFIERFRVEAKNQAKLSHPNIVPVYGFIEEGEILGIVMEIVEGETLEQLLERKGKIELLEAIWIVKQV